MDLVVRKHAATAVREVAKHSPELAQLIVSCGGAGALVDYTASAAGNARLPGIMALGYIAAFSETLALGVIASKGVPPLVAGLAAVRQSVRAHNRPTSLVVFCKTRACAQLLTVVNWEFKGL